MNRDYDSLRQHMVDHQIDGRGIHTPAVVQAFRHVPRHEFVPEEHRHQAYEDHPVSIGCSQTISQPYMVALMTDALCAQPDHRILEVGTGSGYQTAILAELAREVHTIERLPKLGERAQATLARLGYTNVVCHMGDGTLGWPDASPYDGIIVTAGGPRVPPSLVDQLTEGGTLVIPVGTEYQQDLTVATRTATGTQEGRVCGCVFVRLIGAEGWD